MAREDLDLPEEESLRRLWDALDRLPEEQPSPALRQRFYRMLDEEVERAAPKQRPSRGWREMLAALVPQPVRLGVAWALPALVLGVLLGTRVPGSALCCTSRSKTEDGASDGVTKSRSSGSSVRTVGSRGWR